MSKNSSAKYYQKNKEKLQKNASSKEIKASLTKKNQQYN